MSNTQYLGTNAGFYFTPFTGSTWVRFQLAVPLREGRSAARIAQYSADSLDLSRRQTLSVATSGGYYGMWEYLGALRYNDDHDGLAYFLHHAALQSGSTTYPVRYTTGLTTGTSSGGMGPGADVWLIEPSAPLLDTAMDRQRAAFGDLEVTVRFRAYIPTQDFSTGSGARWF